MHLSLLIVSLVVPGILLAFPLAAQDSLPGGAMALPEAHGVESPRNMVAG